MKLISVVSYNHLSDGYSAESRSNVQTVYFKKFEDAVKHINELIATSNIPLDEWDEVAYTMSDLTFCEDAEPDNTFSWIDDVYEGINIEAEIVNLDIR